MQDAVLSVDLGGTKLSLGYVLAGQVHNKRQLSVPADFEKQAFNDFLLGAIGELYQPNCKGIAIGVPSLVEMSQGRVIETTNILYWQDVPLAQLLTERFNCPVVVHNDANCFAAGEYFGGSFAKNTNLIGVCLGTGLGAGLMLEGRLYTGTHSAAGEFGSFPYQDSIIEHYCSGAFFKHRGLNGKEVYEAAVKGDSSALGLFDEFGKHMAHAISLVVLAFNPNVVVLGGSVSISFPLFIDSLHTTLNKISHPTIVENLHIVASNVSDAALKGAAFLFDLQWQNTEVSQ
ncbi:ROK family protein [Pseudoalteromonas tunicata]|uniref:ROK family transcriptional repressor n=1 Tax=Pseudoalteromonas tunicata D2 TaxID=87626 RepID=A4CAN8_9GAMM|nr:ROK family protein [Pseudoalteromonas tunicata]ATC94991.1 glucokinase [Pseudoalteromonas tunicata]AXT30647.1 ROK family protein [Pseudoalteromonas tunicata]EAR28446.1 ROK family transcriptional repressor [Pseudoalteromonas tunicata D2]